MSVVPGTQLGVYEIGALLGAGGMGEEQQSLVASRQSSVVGRRTSDSLTWGIGD